MILVCRRRYLNCFVSSMAGVRQKKTATYLSLRRSFCAAANSIFAVEYEPRVRAAATTCTVEEKPLNAGLVAAEKAERRPTGSTPYYCRLSTIVFRALMLRYKSYSRSVADVYRAAEFDCRTLRSNQIAIIGHGIIYGLQGSRRVGSPATIDSIFRQHSAGQ